MDSIYVYSTPTVERIAPKVFVAKTNVEKPFKSEIEMRGETAQNAFEKLLLFLHDKPYSHIK